MKITIVLVEPEYQRNIGYCARVMKNFGFSDLIIINPKVKIGKEAIKYSKHARDLLKNAKIASDLNKAVKKFNIVVGTTAIKTIGKDILRNAITPFEFVNTIEDTDANVAILIGREGTGLNRRELELCDSIVRIKTDERYPTLNISHALAIILYTFSTLSLHKEKKIETSYLKRKEKGILLKKFNKIVDSCSKGLKSPKTVKLSFKRIINRGIKSDIEGRALLQIIKLVSKKL